MVHLRPQSLVLLSGVIRVFLRHLLATGVVDHDWTTAVPNFRKFQPLRLPAIWTEEQLEQLLAAVDRASAKGKQDYAILLLSCRLGMRASDIRTLRLENLNWDQSRIDFVQSKTGVRNTLPLTEEVGQALADYLRHSRPVSTRREVFLTLHAPFEPFSFQTKFYQIVTRYRQRAKIPIRPDVARGMHSLRHTVASRMLAAGAPLETIACRCATWSCPNSSAERICLRVTLEPSSMPDRSPEAVILVEDEGMGIAPEVLPHIFELFYQVDKSLARTIGGLGVGLTLVRRIVDLHGGNIEAHSAGPGQGSSFCVRLPALVEKDAPLERAGSEGGKLGGSDVEGTILGQNFLWRKR